MPHSIKIAFERRVAVIPLDRILPLKQVPDGLKQTARYRRLVASIGEVGIIEPLVVAKPRDRIGSYLLVDGHLRHAALRDVGAGDARCVIADDDETFTYNKRVNRLATVQEYLMIVKALDRGVSEEKIAKALNVNVDVIKRRRTLLDGICTEVVELLKDRSVNPVVFDVLRKMKPMRQFEAVELMMAAANFTASYAKAMLVCTRQRDLTHPERPKKIGGMTPDQMARMEREMETVQRDFKAVEASYGDDVLTLVVASGYLTRLIGNGEVARYLEQHHPEFIQEFKSIVASSSLDQTSVAA